MIRFKVVQYGRVEHYAVQTMENGSLSTTDIDVVYEHGRPVRFIISHKAELDMTQLRALLEVARRIGLDLGGGKE
jgi:hypothetical protein